MKLLVLSDLHLEFYSEAGISHVIGEICKTEADVLVLAGDISIIREPIYKTIFQMFSENYKNVVYVRGNHEYWHPLNSDPNQHIFLEELENVHELLKEKVVIDGKEFLGCTMWFDHNSATDTYAYEFADFFRIKDLHTWVWEENKKSLQFFEKNLTKDSIVVTHHLPSNKSVHEKYINSDLNPFFVCNWAEQLIVDRQPKLWIHGHTHDSFDYCIGNTRVFCNPFGYYSQLNQSFTLDVIEV